VERPPCFQRYADVQRETDGCHLRGFLDDVMPITLGTAALRRRPHEILNILSTLKMSAAFGFRQGSRQPRDATMAAAAAPACSTPEAARCAAATSPALMSAPRD